MIIKKINMGNKINSLYFLTFIFLFSFTSSQCVLDKNCPSKTGTCQEDVCICINGYKTFIDSKNENNPIYCTYEQKSKWIALVLEMFLPPFGHFYLGRMVHFSIKLTLMVFTLFLINSPKRWIGLIPLIILYFTDLLHLNFMFYNDGNDIPIY